MNYPIAEIDTIAVPRRYKSRPIEEREKEAAERGVELYKVDSSVLDESPIKTSLTWVSHGNYSISQPKPYFKSGPDNPELPYIYIEIEGEYFDQIIKAFEKKEKSEHLFEPFWTADMPLRGMLPIPTQLRAYFCGENGFLLHAQTYNLFSGCPSNHMDQLGFTLEDFRKIKDLVLGAKNKPIHYCKIGWSSSQAEPS